VLVTEWRTRTGAARMTEAMAMGTRAPVLIRTLECVRGSVGATLAYSPRPGKTQDAQCVSPCGPGW